MKLKLGTEVFFIAAIASLASLGAVGCNGDDNRTPSTEEIKVATANRLKYMDSVKMPEAAKRTEESHMGGPAYSNPAIAEAMERAKAGGAKIGPKTRTQ